MSNTDHGKSSSLRNFLHFPSLKAFIDDIKIVHQRKTVRTLNDLPSQYRSNQEAIYLFELLGAKIDILRLIRLLDILISLVLGILAAPVIGITALACFIEDPFQSPLFIQVRAGLYGEKINVIKIRSMYSPKMRELLDINQDYDSITATCDPRVTKVGKIIRKLRLDELPQIYLVLIGIMSLVGPRPETFNYVEKYDEYCPEAHMINLVKPGIYGLTPLFFHEENKIIDGYRDEHGLDVDDNVAYMKTLWFKISAYKEELQDISVKHYFKALFLDLAANAGLKKVHFKNYEDYKKAEENK